MISAGDFRNGVTIEVDGNIFQIVEFQHVKPGKGAAFVRTKLKNIINGGVVEKTFRPTEKFPQARIDRKDMQYLYADGDLFTFMDTETYDQISLNKDTVGDALKFVKENEICKVCSHNGSVFAVEPPLFVELEITDTEPGFKGDTATGASKPATVETGAQVSVPLFVNQGDRIKIDTRTGEYLSRASGISGTEAFSSACKTIRFPLYHQMEEREFYCLFVLCGFSGGRHPAAWSAQIHFTHQHGIFTYQHCISGGKPTERGSLRSHIQGNLILYTHLKKKREEAYDNGTVYKQGQQRGPRIFRRRT